MTQSRTAATVPPILKSIEVARPLDEAFRLFTTSMAQWWPLASHSVGGTDAEWCGIEERVGGRVHERTTSGEEHDWGTVTIWQPPHRIAFTWHPGQPAEPHTEVEVRFAAIADGGTRVRLEHRNWEAIGDRAKEVHQNYVGGWDVVFGEHFGRFADDNR